MTETITYAIADDEILARDSIRILLKNEAQLSLVGEYKDGEEVLNLLKKQSIDLLWLDIQMPKWNGFEVLEQIPSEQMPYIIFVTAYDEFALRAFEYNTIDYLLKPYSNDRFYKALNKAKKIIQHRQMNAFQAPLQDLLQFYKQQQPYRKRLSVKTKDRILLINIKDIDWLKAAGAYVEISVQQRKYLIQDSLKNLETQLNPQAFVRIHRSTMINLERIHSLEPWFNGEYFVVLNNKDRFKLSRNYKDKLSLILNQ